ncbi:MAG: hypothetical protein AAF802_25140, partial [Planctomycetota bacterium]
MADSDQHSISQLGPDEQSDSAGPSLGAARMPNREHQRSTPETDSSLSSGVQNLNIRCGRCERRYVLAVSAAGEQLHCQCGATIDVPRLSDLVERPQTQVAKSVAAVAEEAESSTSQSTGELLDDVDRHRSVESEEPNEQADSLPTAIAINDGDCSDEGDCNEDEGVSKHEGCSEDQDCSEDEGGSVDEWAFIAKPRDVMDPDLVFQQYREPPGRPPIVWQPPPSDIKSRSSVESTNASSLTTVSFDASRDDATKLILKDLSKGPVTARATGETFGLLGRLSVVASVFGIVTAVSIAIAVYRADSPLSRSHSPTKLPKTRRPAIPILTAEGQVERKSERDEASILEQMSLNEALSNAPSQSEPSQSEPTRTESPAETEDPIANQTDELSAFLVPISARAEQLLHQDSIGREELSDFADLIRRLGDREKGFSVADLFWIGDTWEQISRRTPGSELTSKCLWLGASAYAFAKDVEQIRPEEHDR